MELPFGADDFKADYRHRALAGMPATTNKQRLLKAKTALWINPKNFVMRFCIVVAHNKQFDAFILSCIILNCMFLALDEPSEVRLQCRLVEGEKHAIL
jgi:hypothetical protein